MLTAAPMILHPQVTLFFCVLAPASCLLFGRVEKVICVPQLLLFAIYPTLFSLIIIFKSSNGAHFTYVCSTHTKILWLRHRVLFSSFRLLKTTYRSLLFSSREVCHCYSNFFLNGFHTKSTHTSSYEV